MDALDLIETLEIVDLNEIAREAVTMNRLKIADLNAGQLAQGLRATGTEIKPAYHPLTIEIKRGKSGLAAVTDRVTLFNEGDFYRSLYAEVSGDEIVYGARNWKDEKLSKKYGETIHGLTEDSREDLIEGSLRGDTIEQYREATGL